MFFFNEYKSLYLALYSGKQLSPGQVKLFLKKTLNNTGILLNDFIES